jgi:hypothetical protein
MTGCIFLSFLERALWLSEVVRAISWASFPMACASIVHFLLLAQKKIDEKKKAHLTMLPYAHAGTRPSR